MNEKLREQIKVINKKINELNGLYHLAASKVGIADSELRVWSVLLNEAEGYTQQDLCEILSLPKQTVNSLISKFVKNEYVILEHVEGSKNRKEIRVTELGKNYANNKVRWIFQAEDHAMADTKAENIEIAIHMMESYISSFKRELEV